jgi:hypothetical protein
MTDADLSRRVMLLPCPPKSLPTTKLHPSGWPVFLPTFKQMKRGKLAKPLHKMGSARIHAKLTCDAEIDYTSRELPGAPELSLKTSRSNLDPRQANDRNHLIECFCTACGITMGTEGGLWN